MANEQNNAEKGLLYEIGRTILLLAGTFFAVWVVVFIALSIANTGG